MKRETTCPPPPILYKFSKRKYLEAFLTEGAVSFAVATAYKDSALTDGQQDNEIARDFSPDAGEHMVIVGKGTEAKPIKNLTKLKLTLDLKSRGGAELRYYIWCASLGYSEELFSEFKADACVRINDPGTFGERLLVKARASFPSTKKGIPGCDLYGRNVSYYDEKRLPPTLEQKDLIFLKKSRFMHQAEFRFIFATDPEKSPPDRFEFRLGSLQDIAEFYKC